MRSRNYTIAERAVILIGLMANRSLEEINDMLVKDQQRMGIATRVVPVSSYNIMKRCYLQHISSDPDLMWSHISNPQSINQLGKLS